MPPFIYLFRLSFNSYLHGGADSGFRAVKPEEYTPRLFHFHGDKFEVTVKEVAITKLFILKNSTITQLLIMHGFLDFSKTFFVYVITVDS